MFSNKKSKFISNSPVGYGRILRLRPISNGVKKKKARLDIEKMYPKTEFIKKLRRFADALETGRRFSIQIAGEKYLFPKMRLSILNTNEKKERKNLNFK
ncbi:MAG: hypothetical protein DDT19_01673 [Syntrophomonadaceae bacterium]|nr:hypothetical protein [Bacillota bacterium]